MDVFDFEINRYFFNYDDILYKATQRNVFLLPFDLHKILSCWQLFFGFGTEKIWALSYSILFEVWKQKSISLKLDTYDADKKTLLMREVKFNLFGKPLFTTKQKQLFFILIIQISLTNIVCTKLNIQYTCSYFLLYSFVNNSFPSNLIYKQLSQVQSWYIQTMKTSLITTW